MFREIQAVRQNENEPHKRWFNSPKMDLFIWSNSDDKIIKYQLTYTLRPEKKALTWHEKSGLTHAQVDGSRSGNYPASPILIADDQCDMNLLLTLFIENSAEMEHEIKTFIIDTIKHSKG